MVIIDGGLILRLSLTPKKTNTPFNHRLYPDLVAGRQESRDTEKKRGDTETKKKIFILTLSRTYSRYHYS